MAPHVALARMPVFTPVQPRKSHAVRGEGKRTSSAVRTSWTIVGPLPAKPIHHEFLLPQPQQDIVLEGRTQLREF